MMHFFFRATHVWEVLVGPGMSRLYWERFSHGRVEPGSTGIYRFWWWQMMQHWDVQGNIGTWGAVRLIQGVGSLSDPSRCPMEEWGGQSARAAR